MRWCPRHGEKDHRRILQPWGRLGLRTKVVGGEDSRCGCTAVSKIRGLRRRCHGPDEGGHEKTVLGRIASKAHPGPRRGGGPEERWRCFSFKSAAGCVKSTKGERRCPRAEIVESTLCVPRSEPWTGCEDSEGDSDLDSRPDFIF